MLGEEVVVGVLGGVEVDHKRRDPGDRELDAMFFLPAKYLIDGAAVVFEAADRFDRAEVVEALVVVFVEAPQLLECDAGCAACVLHSLTEFLGYDDLDVRREADFLRVEDEAAGGAKSAADIATVAGADCGLLTLATLNHFVDGHFMLLLSSTLGLLLMCGTGRTVGRLFSIKHFLKKTPA